ncbi:MAG: aminotransferase class III-fold pyridoxal phosphate-dependent enzyme, partial [Chloroflexi bacterium]|nr:aminotransferase class III-fold pyridoxal phosphate-dependent enzyme [Chloroflexota bacterium]
MESHVFYRRLGRAYPVAERGEGIYLYDAAGKRYLDASGGPVVVNIGHGVAEVVQAMAEQAGRVAYAHAEMFTTQVLEEYARALAEIVPLPDPRFFFLSSGSEAVETAIKFARQVQIDRGEPGRYMVISRWRSYHGTTLGALAVSGRAHLRQPFLPLMQDLPQIPPPYCYRCPWDQSYPGCDIDCAQALEAAVRLAGPENVAAFIAEPISGASLGAAAPPPEYWPLVREICDRYGLLLIADEVMTGFGRTGRWFAMQHWDVVPDVIVMAKGAAGGYFPLSITAVRGEWVEVIRKGHGDFVHGGTFSHHAVGAAAGLAVLRYLQKNDLVTASAVKGKALGEKLSAALGDLPCVGDVRGMGLMWGVEFVADRATKAPFPQAARFARRVADAAFDKGLIVYPGTGCADGVAGDLVMVAPPFIITE